MSPTGGSTGHNLPIQDEVVICRLEDPTPIAYLNVYDEGDVWIKTRGCEDCTLENRRKCCGNSCPMFSSKGCFFHLDSIGQKPWRCVVYPQITTCLSWCCLEYTCVAGPRAGLMHKLCEPADKFHLGEQDHENVSG